MGPVGDADSEGAEQLKLHCVQSDSSVMDFVVHALEEKLAKSGGRKRAARSA